MQKRRCLVFRTIFLNAWFIYVYVPRFSALKTLDVLSTITPSTKPYGIRGTYLAIYCSFF